MVTTKLVTAEDLLLMPKVASYELIRGELHDVPPAGMRASEIAHWIGTCLTLFVRPRGLGRVTGADGGYVLSRHPDTVVAPDVGFVRTERLPRDFNDEKHCPIPPDLAVEVVSPSDTIREWEDKLKLNADAGVPLVWRVEARRRTVAIYERGHMIRELGEGDVLDGAPVLPDFRLAVSDIFR